MIPRPKPGLSEGLWVRALSQPMCRLLTLALVMFVGSSCRSPQQPSQDLKLERFEFDDTQMGMAFRIVLYAADASAAHTASRAAFARIQALNQIFSDYETESELNLLSQQAGQEEPVPLSPELWCVLERAQALARQTDGAFDVTIGPVTALWRKARREKRLPEAARLEAARSRVGYEKLLLDPTRQTARLVMKNMRLDLGGIAKGYALDAALRTLHEHGISRALVSGGGDIVVGDPPPGRAGWRIELTSLESPRARPSRCLALARAAVATSGDLFQHLELGGQRYSHIVDPRTGLGLTDQSLVHVVAPDGMTADSLATALSVMNPGKQPELVAQWPGTAAWVVRKPGHTLEEWESPRFKDYLEP